MTMIIMTIIIITFHLQTTSETLKLATKRTKTTSKGNILKSPMDTRRRLCAEMSVLCNANFFISLQSKSGSCLKSGYVL